MILCYIPNLARWAGEVGLVTEGENIRILDGEKKRAGDV
jgi:hypothetical protein